MYRTACYLDRRSKFSSVDRQGACGSEPGGIEFAESCFLPENEGRESVERAKQASCKLTGGMAIATARSIAIDNTDNG